MDKAITQLKNRIGNFGLHLNFFGGIINVGGGQWVNIYQCQHLLEEKRENTGKQSVKSTA